MRGAGITKTGWWTLGISATLASTLAATETAIVEILQAHKDRLNVRQLLAQIYFLQPSEKAACMVEGWISFG